MDYKIMAGILLVAMAVMPAIHAMAVSSNSLHFASVSDPITLTMHAGDATTIAGDTLTSVSISPATTASYNMPQAAFQLTDSSGNSIDTFTLYQGQAYAKNGVSVTANQVYIASGAASYVVVQLYSTSGTGGLTLTTDSSSYATGSPVTVTLSNNGTTTDSFTLAGCEHNIAVTDSNGNALVINSPVAPHCMMMRMVTLAPGQSSVIDSWNQQVYTCVTATSGGMDEQCTASNAPAGTYVISFQGATTKISLIGGPTVTPPAPPSGGTYTVTVNLNSGWNMVSSPVYNSMSNCPPIAPGQPAYGMPCYVGAGKPQITSNTCTVNSIWGFSGYYYKVALGDVKPNTGYWFDVAGACSITFTGDTATTVSNYHTYLRAGWNLFSAPYTSDGSAIPFSSISTVCSVTGGPWYYDSIQGQYVQVTSLTPGQAYWVRVSNYCSLGNGSYPYPLASASEGISSVHGMMNGEAHEVTPSATEVTPTATATGTVEATVQAS